MLNVRTLPRAVRWLSRLVLPSRLAVAMGQQVRILRGVESMTRRIDGLEAAANAVAGLAISATAVQVLWPLFGWQATIEQSSMVAAVFFVLSTARSYVLRRIFRRMQP